MDQSIDITHQEGVVFEGEVGKVFSVRIEGNITTGYNWFLTQNDNDSDPVACTNLSEMGTGDYESQQPQTGGHPGMRTCGAPGFLVFNFQIRQPGEHKLVLKYKRPWETEPIRTKTITFLGQ